MPSGLLVRARARWARVLGRAFAYWVVAAAIVCVTLATQQWAEERERRHATEAASIPRVELAQRAVRNALSAARADLHLLASMGVVGDFLSAADPVRRAALARDLFGFMATRDWCERVVVSGGSARVAGERQPGAPACDALRGVAAAFPSSEALLAVVRVTGSPRLCLGLPLGTGPDGTPAVLMAEADPRALFPDLPLLGPEGGAVFLRDAQGQWLVAPDTGTRRLELRPFGMRSWSGPSAGTWHIAYAPDEQASSHAASSRRRNATVAALLLLASAAGAMALARAGEAGTRAKSEFLAMMSHEMRTPLHAVLGGTALLAEGPLDAEQAEQVAMIGTAGRALLHLIDDLLDSPSTGDEVEVPGSALQSLGNRPCHALLVEDNRVNQRVTSALLARLGCRVDVAGDGAQALEALTRRRYDVVFMDCRMPGMSGYEATREIRRREGAGPQVPIVALTANALRGDRERCLEAGMTDYLAKPVELASLGRVLGRYVARVDAPEVAVKALEATLVDPQALANLRMLERDGPGFLVTIVREFDEGARQRLGDMQLAARVGDGEGLHGAAHSLKGSAGIFGARGIAELCRRLEHMASEGSVADASPLIAQLTHEHAALMTVLQEAAASAVPA